MQELKELKVVEGILKALIERAKNMTIEQKLAWLHGFVYGDISILVNNTLGLETPRLDTLLAFLTIVTSFANYQKYGTRGAVRVYPYIRIEDDTKSLQKYKWHVFVYVIPEVYHKVIQRNVSILNEYINRLDLLATFTAGLIDSDGTVVISVKKRRGRLYFEPELEIVNTDKDMLTMLQHAWKQYGITLGLHIHSNIGRAKTFTRTKPVWRLRTCSYAMLSELIKYVLPYMYNTKRIARATIARSYIEELIPKDPILIKTASDKLAQHYEHRLRELSMYIIEQLYWRDKILVIKPNGSIEITKRVYPLYGIE